MRYRADIDGLRAVAVTAVILYHAEVPGFAGGFVGVDVFFVISGFLIMSMLAEGQRAPGGMGTGDFLLRRARRLVPLMLVVALVTVLPAWFILLPHYLKDFGQSLVAAPFFTVNFLFWHEAGYFTPRAGAKPLLHLWSLALEGQFYLAFPLLLVALARLGLSRDAVLAGIAGASFLLGAWASQAHPEAAFYLLPFRLWEFLAGALLALRPGVLSRVPAAAGLLMIGAAIFAFDQATAFPGVAALLPVVGAALAIGGRGAGQGPLAAAPAAFLGRISYGLYLWHYPVFVLLWQAVPGLSLAPLLPLLLPALIALSWLSYRWIEQPFRRPQGGRAARLAALAGIALVAGAALHASGGAPGRLPAEARLPLAHAERWAMPCHDLLTGRDLARGQVCRIGDPRAAPRIALLGDSHAGQLTPALGPALAARGEAALVFSRGWCAPLPGFGTRAPGRGPECAAFMDEAWRAIARAGPVDTVVLAAQWANFTDGKRGALAPVAYGTARDPAGNAAAFAAALKGLAQGLGPGGPHLVVVGPVPEYDRPVPDIIARAAWRSGVLPDRLAAIDHRQRNDAALSALGEFAALTGAPILDARAAFCEGGSCRVRDASGRPYWRDEAHLSTLGATLVVERLMPLLPAARPR